MSHIKQNNAMDIVATVLAKQQENSIAGYDFNGIELTQSDSLIMGISLIM